MSKTNNDFFRPRPANLLPAITQGERLLTVRDLLLLLFKHNLLVLTAFATVSAVMFSGLASIPPTYVSKAKILFKTEQQGTPNFLSGISAYREAQLIDPSSRKIETEMQILTSRGLAERVVAKLGLGYEQIYHPPLAHIIRRVNGWWKVMMSWFGLAKESQVTQAELAEAFVGSIKLVPLKSKQAETNSNLIAVELRATDPQRAEQALSVLLEEYFPYGMAVDQRAGEQAIAVVREHLAAAEKDLRKSQQALQQFVARKAEGGTLQQDTASMADSGERSVTSEAGLLRARLTQLELDLAEAQEQYTDTSAPVAALKAAISRVRKRLSDTVAKGAEEDSTLMSLKRNFSIAEEKFMDLNRKNNQIELFLKMTPTQSSQRELVEAPTLPEQSEWKQKALVGVVGAVGGLLLGLALAGLREMGDHTLQSMEDVRIRLGLPTLAAVCRLSRPRLKRFCHGDVTVLGQESLGVRFRNMVGRLWLQARAAEADRGVVVVVTGVRDGEGTSTLAEAVAAFAAGLKQGAVVLWQASGSLGQAAGDQPASVPGTPGLSCLTSQSLVAEEDWQTGSLRLLDSLRQRYALVVVDSPPLPQCTSLLWDSADAVILTVDARRTSSETVWGAMEVAHFDPRRLSGIILNRQPRHIPRWLYSAL